MNPPTKKQLRIVAAIASHIEARGRPPTLRELAAAIGVRPATIHAHLDACVRKGLLERDAGRPCGLRVVAR